MDEAGGKGRLTASDEEEDTLDVRDRVSPLSDATRPTAPGADPTARAVIERGSIIAGRYKIKRQLAIGSMSRVFVAEQMGVGREVVLKLIHREFAVETDSVARFQREAHVLARIDHPNIVTVYDIGQTTSGSPYIVMEYVPGPSLADIVQKETTLAPARVIRLLLQIARALTAVHERGVIHRDLKPGNVLVHERKSGVEVAKIGDFGLAKVVRDRGDAEFLTRAGTVLGTPEFMAPEQVLGKDIDHRADIYSLGCMAYEMLVGRPPFVGDEMATLYRHLHEAPEPLASVNPEAGIQAPFQELIDRALAKDPNERHVTAFEFYEHLLRVADETRIPSSELLLLESLFDDPAYARTHQAGVDDTGSSARLRTAPVVAPAPRRSGAMIAAFGVALVAGAAIGWLASGTADSAAADGRGVVIVKGAPEGAKCTLDGEPESCPAVFDSVAAGPHELVVERDGYATRTFELHVESGATTRIDAPLRRPTYSARIDTEPARATVIVDGEELGTAPVTAEIAEGVYHSVEARLHGYQSRKRFVSAFDRIDDVTIRLRPSLLRFGSVFVESDSPGKVLINDDDFDYWTPTGEIQLSPGEYTITFREAVGTRTTKTIQVVEGDVTHVSF